MGVDSRRAGSPAVSQTLRWWSGRLRLGLADVQLILAAAAVVKVADSLIRGYPIWYTVAWAVCAVTVRRWPLATAVVAFVSAIPDGSNHVILFGWMTLTLAVTDRVADTFRILGMTVYGFATIHKVWGGYFITGTPITLRSGIEPPLAVVLAVGALAAQVVLVWALWRRHRLAVPAAVGMHVGITAVMAASWLDVLQLAVFNGLMVAVVVVAVNGLAEFRDRGEVPHHSESADIPG